MDANKRKSLEAAGWRFGDAADFLEMSEEERQLLEARISIAVAIRREREARGMTQKELGALLNTSQPRVAKIERAAADVSLDQLLRALTALGGELIIPSPKKRAKAGPAKGKKGSRVVLEVVASS